MWTDNVYILYEILRQWHLKIEGMGRVCKYYSIVVAYSTQLARLQREIHMIAMAILCVRYIVMV